MTTIPTNKIPRLNTNPIIIDELERSFNSLILIDRPKAVIANPKSAETIWWFQESICSQMSEEVII